MYKSRTWQHEITGSNGKTLLFGVNIFDYEWNETGESVSVRDPLYNQDYMFPVYTVNIDGELHSFAAGEFSNDIWGFYLFKYYPKEIN